MRDGEVIERIKVLCESRAWTTYKLAKESGITYSTLCTMLHKSNAPSIPTLEKICKGFGITLSQFFDTKDGHAMITPMQKEHLRQWESLTDENKQAAEKYLSFLLAQQNTEE